MTQLRVNNENISCCNITLIKLYHNFFNICWEKYFSVSFKKPSSAPSQESEGEERGDQQEVCTGYSILRTGEAVICCFISRGSECDDRWECVPSISFDFKKNLYLNSFYSNPPSLLLIPLSIIPYSILPFIYYKSKSKVILIFTNFLSLHLKVSLNFCVSELHDFLKQAFV